MNKDRLLSRINNTEDQISCVNEKLYDPDLTVSDQRELLRKKKKLSKIRNKLNKRLKKCV